MTIDELIQLAGDLQLDPIDLDTDVHDHASQMASGVNNAGLDAQIRFLVEQIGEEDCENLLRQEHEIKFHGD